MRAGGPIMSAAFIGFEIAKITATVPIRRRSRGQEGNEGWSRRWPGAKPPSQRSQTGVPVVTAVRPVIRRPFVRKAHKAQTLEALVAVFHCEVQSQGRAVLAGCGVPRSPGA